MLTIPFLTAVSFRVVPAVFTRPILISRVVCPPHAIPNTCDSPIPEIQFILTRAKIYEGFGQSAIPGHVCKCNNVCKKGRPLFPMCVIDQILFVLLSILLFSTRSRRVPIFITTIYRLLPCFADGYNFYI